MRNQIPEFSGMFQKEVAQRYLRKRRKQKIWHTFCFNAGIL